MGKIGHERDIRSGQQMLGEGLIMIAKRLKSHLHKTGSFGHLREIERLLKIRQQKLELDYCFR